MEYTCSNVKITGKEWVRPLYTNLALSVIDQISFIFEWEFIIVGAYHIYS